MNIGRLAVIGLALMLAGVVPPWSQLAVHDGTAASDHAMHALSDDHSVHGDHATRVVSADARCGAAHRAVMTKPGLKVSMHSYRVPDVELIDDSGTPVVLRTLLAGDQPVAVNFIFTTCTTICPVMTATFAQMRRALGPEADRIQLVSITIDPEHDTPAALARYAERFHATAGWRFLTGSPADVERVLRTFDAWTGSKTSHRPITLLRRPGDSEWVRLEGLASGSTLAEQARTVLQ